MIDLIMTVVTIGFAYSLIPQIIKSTKEKQVAIAYQTLVICVIGVWTMAICFLTMGKSFTGIANMVTASAWSYLLVFKFFFIKRESI